MEPGSRWVARLVSIVGAAATMLAAGCDATFLRLAKLPRDVVEQRDLVYRPGSTNPKHRLDVFAPAGAHRAPVVHFVHGGYWVGGDKDYHAWITSLYASVGRALAARGVVTVVQSYRLVPDATFDELVDDVMAGLRWTEDHAAEYGGDPRRLFMMGHSAGGHLVALAGTDESLHTRRGMDPDRVKGYIPISAIWDIADMHATQDETFQERVTYPVFGRDPARWAEVSPIRKLQKPRRFLIMIGAEDYPYLIPQASRARGKLAVLGADPAFYVAPGNDHDAMVLRFGAKNDNMTTSVVDFVFKDP
jgi:acetyl esterase/lipase